MTGRYQHARVKIGQRGTIVIPAELRRELELETGDELDLVAEGETLVISKVDSDPIVEFREMGARYYAGIDPVRHQRELRDDGP